MDFWNIYEWKIGFITLIILFFSGSLLSQQDSLSKPISLNQDSSFINGSGSIISVGYGWFSNNSITGAISHISNEGFNQGMISDPLLLIQGKVAGMQVYNRGGDPNLSSLVRIRGLSGYANRKPLIVIDGIVGASLQNLDPNDIASFTVLKDGSSQAMYGIRASNGVILIKTKIGKYTNDTLSLAYTGQLSVTSAHTGIPVMNAEEFRLAGGVDIGSSTNWLDKVKRNGISNVHGLAVKGSQGHTNYRLSGNYRSEEGILRKSGFDQSNIRVNMSSRLFRDALEIQVTASYTNRNNQLGFNEAFRYAVSFNPTIPLLAKDAPFPYNTEQFGGLFETIGLYDSFNPKAIVDLNERNSKLQVFTTAALLKYKIKPGFALNFRYAFQDQFSNTRAYYSPQSYFRGNAYHPLIETRGRADLKDYEDTFSLYELFGNFNKGFGDSKLGLTFGTAYQDGNHADHYLRLDGFSNESLADTKRIGDYQNWTDESIYRDTINNSWANKLSAIFGGMSLNVADKFMLNTSLRYEGSSKLGKDKRWGFYPAFGVALDLDNIWEIQSIDRLKLRMGYGVTGGIPINGGLSQQKTILYEQEDGSFLPNTVRHANPDLKWEQKNEVNIGLDFHLGILQGHIDWYSRKVKDWISPDHSGFRRAYFNQNSLKSRGLELGLELSLLNSYNYGYSTGIQLSKYHSQYENLVDSPRLAIDPCCASQNPIIPLQEGEDIGNIMAPVFIGANSSMEPVYEDVNRDGMIFTDLYYAFEPESDIAIIGNGLPDYELGWSHKFRIHGWNINTLFRGAFGHSMANMQRLFYEPRNYSFSRNYNLVNTELAIDGLIISRYSSLYVEKASFFKLDNLSIAKSFTIGAGSHKKLLSLRLTGQNLFVITNYTGPDPEPVFEDFGSTSNGGLQFDLEEANPLAPGIDRRNHYLPSRSFVIGISLGF